MQQVQQLIAKVAPTDSTVLILGETGTGKELVARAVHEQSLRAEKPFVAINCGALPENLIESELFGHRKGRSPGPTSIASGCSKWPTAARSSSTRSANCPRRCRPSCCGCSKAARSAAWARTNPFTVDVRVVCATHRDLEEMVAEDEFREDLMFRINTFEIHLPPLRERIDDIPQLARHLLCAFPARTRRAPTDELLTPEAHRRAADRTSGRATFANWPT